MLVTTTVTIHSTCSINLTEVQPKSEKLSSSVTWLYLFFTVLTEVQPKSEKPKSEKPKSEKPKSNVLINLLFCFLVVTGEYLFFTWGCLLLYLFIYFLKGSSNYVPWSEGEGAALCHVWHSFLLTSGKLVRFFGSVLYQISSICRRDLHILLATLTWVNCQIYC
jgi:hypothetical protein